ncbi:hypothetical protein J6590_084459 [Homalodisca vitripennis]|nr:hypothetical protein J6590_084459 [Homalodisca vitripennis]
MIAECVLVLATASLIVTSPITMSSGCQCAIRKGESFPAVYFTSIFRGNETIASRFYLSKCVSMRSTSVRDWTIPP